MGNFFLLIAWLYANVASLRWLTTELQNITFSNGVLLIGGGLGILTLAGRSQLQNYVTQISTTPIFHRFPVLIMLLGGVGALVFQQVWEIQQGSAFCFLLGSYGLLGLWLSPSVWRNGLPIAVLFAGVLPFSLQFSTGLGFPVRALTANIVEQCLNAWQVSAVSANDIILLENGIARVDLPCSGLKSLWIGTLFLLVTTYLEQRAIGIRWLLVWLMNLLLLISANILRVMILVFVTYAMHQPKIADILHVPLGLLGFMAACGATWLILQWVPKQPQDSRQDPSAAKQIGRQQQPIGYRLSKQVLLITILLGLGLISSLYTPPHLGAIAAPQLPAQIRTQPIPLTDLEQSFFSHAPATLAQKQRFAIAGLTGSLLIVTSRSWSAFHPPEVCLSASGLTVETLDRQHLTPDILARWLTLQGGNVSATYWLQSSQRTTDDFVSQLWEYVVRQQKTWALVSILFDRAYAPTQPEIQNLVTLVHSAVHRSQQEPHD
jgi:exosortase O